MGGLSVHPPALGPLPYWGDDYFGGLPVLEIRASPRGTPVIPHRCRLIPERSGIGDQPQSEAQMIKSLAPLAIFALLGAFVIADVCP